ncbi:MAG: hypothetical protein LLF76_02670 [Planctomycetaceae bacterium]|nr:hypothetical protein [Planctomycetaceae bacterium]
MRKIDKIDILLKLLELAFFVVLMAGAIIAIRKADAVLCPGEHLIGNIFTWVFFIILNIATIYRK